MMRLYKEAAAELFDVLLRQLEILGVDVTGVIRLDLYQLSDLARRVMDLAMAERQGVISSETFARVVEIAGAAVRGEDLEARPAPASFAPRALPTEEIERRLWYRLADAYPADPELEVNVLKLDGNRGAWEGPEVLAGKLFEPDVLENGDVVLAWCWRPI